MNKILITITNGYSLDADNLSDDEIEDIIQLIYDNDYEEPFTGEKSGTFHIINNAKHVHFEADAWYGKNHE